MPTKEEIDESPYHDKLKRPTGSATSRASHTSQHTSQSTDQSKSLKKQSRAKSAPASRSKKGKTRAKSPSEKTRVSRTLTRQLENYINIEKREQQFSTNGIVTTTHRMEPYDVAYRLIEADQLERDSPRNPKSKYKGARGIPQIDPRVEDNSRRVAQYAEIDRLVQNANSIYHSLPISKLTSIHGYRPHPKNEVVSPHKGKVHGYHRHFGAALHAHKYVDFYTKAELHDGSPSCGRLKKLPKKQGDSMDDSLNTTASSRKSTSHMDRQDRRNGNRLKPLPCSEPGDTNRSTKTGSSRDKDTKTESYSFIREVLAKTEPKKKTENKTATKHKSRPKSTTNQTDLIVETPRYMSSPRPTVFEWRQGRQNTEYMTLTDDFSISRDSIRSGTQLPPLKSESRQNEDHSNSDKKSKKKRSKKRKQKKSKRTKKQGDGNSFDSQSRTSISTESDFDYTSQSSFSVASTRRTLRSPSVSSLTSSNRTNFESDEDETQALVDSRAKKTQNQGTGENASQDKSSDLAPHTQTNDEKPSKHSEPKSASSVTSTNSSNVIDEFQPERKPDLRQASLSSVHSNCSRSSKSQRSQRSSKSLKSTKSSRSSTHVRSLQSPRSSKSPRSRSRSSSRSTRSSRSYQRSSTLSRSTSSSSRTSVESLASCDNQLESSVRHLDKDAVIKADPTTVRLEDETNGNTYQLRDSNTDSKQKKSSESDGESSRLGNESCGKRSEPLSTEMNGSFCSEDFFSD